MAGIGLEELSPIRLTPKERATQAREIFCLMRSAYENSKQRCAFKRYKELKRIVDIFTSEPVMNKLHLLTGASSEVESRDCNWPESFSSATALWATCQSPSHEQPGPVEFRIGGFGSSSNLLRPDSRSEDLSPSYTPDSAFSSKPDGLNSVGTSSLNTPSSPRYFVFPVSHPLDNPTLSPRTPKRQSDCSTSRADTPAPFGSPQFSKSLTLPSSMRRHALKTSTRALKTSTRYSKSSLGLGFPQPAIRKDQIPEFQIPKRKSTRGSAFEMGFSASASEFEGLNSRYGRSKSSSPCLLGSDVHTASYSDSPTQVDPCQTGDTASARRSGCQNGSRKDRHGSCSLDLKLPKLYSESDFFDRRDARHWSHSSLASEMEEATIKMAYAKIQKLKTECEALKSKSVVYKYIRMKRVLKNCIYTFI